MEKKYGEIEVPEKYVPVNLQKNDIDKLDKKMRIEFLTSLIKENEIDHARLEKELKELV